MRTLILVMAVVVMTALVFDGLTHRNPTASVQAAPGTSTADTSSMSSSGDMSSMTASRSG